jgi:hypothetical protein
MLMRLHRFLHGKCSLTRGSYRFPNDRRLPANARARRLFIFFLAPKTPSLAAPDRTDGAPDKTEMATLDRRMIVPIVATPTPAAFGSKLRA